MSQSLTRERPSIDTDEFERRLHQHDLSAQRNDDPLAELARLVGEHNDPYSANDPYGDVFAQDVLAQQPHATTAYAPGERREPGFGAPGQSPRLSGDFAAIEAGLRGALAAHPETAPNPAEHEFFAQHDQYGAPEDYAHHDQAQLHAIETAQWAAPPQPQMARAASRRGRRPIYAVAATIAVGVIGVGVAFAYKGTSSSPSAIRTIAAASGPTKIRPPEDASADAGSQDSAMLGKRGADSPTQLVNREEQPVDISQAVQENASRDADAGPAPGDASNVAVPPSPSQATGGSDQMGFGVGMPAPKRVKVVSVRPDGTILHDDAAPSGAMPTSRQAAQPDDQDPIAKASSPQSMSTPASGSKAAKTGASKKSTSRIAAKAKAPADNADDASAAKPTRTRVASAEAEDTTASLGSHSGGFAVQLAAPGSESDARSVSSRLAKKFSAALSGHHLGFHKAQSNGKSVYRVRVGSLSKQDATSLCEKLKSDGGSCFVAKNN